MAVCDTKNVSKKTHFWTDSQNQASMMFANSDFFSVGIGRDQFQEVDLKFYIHVNSITSAGSRIARQLAVVMTWEVQSCKVISSSCL
jgi:hypothetical protein